MSLKFVKYFFWQNWFGSGYTIGPKFWIRNRNTGSKYILVILKLNTCKNRFKRHSHTHTKKHTKTSPVKHRPAKVTLLYKVLKDHRLLLRKMQCRHKKTTPNFLLSIDILLHDSKSTFTEVFTSTYLAKVDVKLIFNQKMHQRNVTPPIIFRFYWRLLRKLHFFFSNFPFPSESFLFIYLAFNRSFFRYLHQYSDTCVNIALIYTFPACFVTWFDRFFIGSKKSVLFICMHASKSLWIFDTMVWLFHKKNF